MHVDSIIDGVVIDHLKAGNGMKAYKALELHKYNSCIIVVENASSKSMGLKDMIKIKDITELNYNILAGDNPDMTINFIQEGWLYKKFTL